MEVLQTWNPNISYLSPTAESMGAMGPNRLVRDGLGGFPEGAGGNLASMEIRTCELRT